MTEEIDPIKTICHVCKQHAVVHTKRVFPEGYNETWICENCKGTAIIGPFKQLPGPPLAHCCVDGKTISVDGMVITYSCDEPVDITVESGSVTISKQWK